MLDSLVRVSRRVGQVTDRFATDAEHAPERPPAERPRSGGTGDSPSKSVGRAETASNARRAKGLPRPAGGPTRSGSITPSPRRRPPSPDASDRRRAGRGARHAESAPAATLYDACAAPARRCRHLRRSAADGLNPTRRHCGPLRLPLDGFTYC
jgi:hypothetical protein